jgi:hypothetical protein
MMICPGRAVLAAVVVAGLLHAQSFDDLTTVRNPKLAWSQVFQVKAGVLGAIAGTEDEAAGLQDDIGWDGHVWYHADGGGQGGDLDAYAGRDGLYFGMKNGNDPNATATKLELKARMWPFYREGAYRGDAFVPIGLYEGRDYEAYLGFGREVQSGLFVELGPFYRRQSFDRNKLTDPGYTIPDDFNAYGGRLFLEQSTVQFDRRSGLATDGFVATVIGEREWNDSDTEFGSAGLETELPSAVWRARARLEWYIAQSDETCWEVFGNASYTDVQDRVYNYDAQRPQGHLWADAQLRFRMRASDSITVTPFAHVQYQQLREEDGAGSDKKAFFGGGIDAWLHVADNISFNAWYSFLDNESRPSVSISEDAHGEHMFFVGVVFQFGAKRR